MRLYIFIFALMAVLFISCEKDSSPDVEVFDQVFQIELDYRNLTGMHPILAIDWDSTSSEVIVHPSQILAASDGNVGVDIQLGDVRIFDGTKNFELGRIKVEELNDQGEWIEDQETSSSFENISSLNAVLVMDKSASLEEEMSDIKQYAKSFIDYVDNEIPDAKFGIVGFASTVESMPITNDSLDLVSFIDSLQPEEFTKLYDGIYEGIESLRASTTNVDSRTLMVFTDGRDNFSSVSLTPDFLIDEMLSSDISTFTIGLNGQNNVDQYILDTLSVGGLSVYPENLDQLEKSFQDFSELVSHVYDLNYRRSNQVVINLKKIRITLYAN